jgi:hypothetical protein
LALAAEPASLQVTSLRKAVSGKTVYLKISGFELPIRYSPGGSISGRMGAVAATLARGDGASDRGKWWVSGNQLCQRWSSWMEGKSYCYTLTRRGNSVSWVRMTGAPAARGSAECFTVSLRPRQPRDRLAAKLMRAICRGLSTLETDLSCVVSRLHGCPTSYCTKADMPNSEAQHLL